MTTEKKAQIAAMNAKGMTVEEISKATGVNCTDVEVFIATRPNPETRASKPREEYHRMTTKERAKIIELSDSGIKQADISRQLGIPRSTVSRVLIDAGKNTRAKSIEKEPASAATDTSSEVRNCPNISTSKDNTKASESQALEAAKKKPLAIYETLTPEECRAWEIGEVYAEIVRGCGE